MGRGNGDGSYGPGSSPWEGVDFLPGVAGAPSLPLCAVASEGDRIIVISAGFAFRCRFFGRPAFFFGGRRRLPKGMMTGEPSESSMSVSYHVVLVYMEDLPPLACPSICSSELFAIGQLVSKLVEVLDTQIAVYLLGSQLCA